MKLYKNINNKNNVKAYKYNASSVKEWNNSIYNYNLNNNAHLNIIDKKVRKLLKSYFNLITKRSFNYIRRILLIKRILIRKWKKNFFWKNKMYLSKLELKHTSSKVIITIYVFLRRRKRRIFRKKVFQWINKKGLKSLNRILENIYKKEVKIRIIRIKYPYLNTSILVEYLVLRLTSGRYRILNSYRKILRRIKFAKINKNPTEIDKSKVNLINMSLLNNISNISFKKLKKKTRRYRKKLIRGLLSLTKNKALTGIRFEISGRLNRRRIAARSVNKVSQKGTLKNVYSSYKNLPSTLLRGSVRPNLDYHQLNSKTRNGSFNVKGWVSSCYSTYVSTN